MKGNVMKVRLFLLLAVVVLFTFSLAVSQEKKVSKDKTMVKAVEVKKAKNTYMKKLKNNLELNKEQVKKISPIISDFHKKNTHLKNNQVTDKESREQRKKLKMNRDEKIMRVLDYKQKASFKEMQKKRKGKPQKVKKSKKKK